MSHSIAIVAALIALNTVEARSQDVYIDVGEAQNTLNEWSRQTDLQVLFDFNRLRGIWTNKVVCDCTAAESLQQLIRHLGLTYDFVNPRTVAVTPSLVSIPAPLVYPSPEQYQMWFDRADLFQPAKSYGYDQNVRAGAIEAEYPGENNGQDADSNSRDRSGSVAIRTLPTGAQGITPVHLSTDEAGASGYRSRTTRGG